MASEEDYNELAVDGKVSSERFKEFIIGKFASEGFDEGITQMVMPLVMMGGLGEGEADEFKKAMLASLGDSMGPILDIVYAFFDQNGDGNISLQEFQSVTSTLEADPTAAIKAAFNVIDKNGNGKIEVEEAAAFITRLCGLGADCAHSMVGNCDQFLRGAAMSAIVEQMFGALDADGDGMVSNEEGHAVADEMLAMMEQQANGLMEAPEDALPPQAVAIRKYVQKAQDETIPAIKAELSSDPVSKEDFMRVIKEVGLKQLRDGDLMKQSLAMNPQMEMMPPPLKELIEKAVGQIAEDIADNMDGVGSAAYDLFAVDGSMSQAQLEAYLTFFMPMGAQAKFDQMWGLLDSDNDGKITKDEAKDFLNRVFDLMVAMAHFLIEIYKSMIAKMGSAVAAEVIKAKSADGLTLENCTEIMDEGPEMMMAVMMGGQ
jgi:Ca2+-binding EF-hand superfamily protein